MRLEHAAGRPEAPEGVGVKGPRQLQELVTADGRQPFLKLPAVYLHLDPADLACIDARRVRALRCGEHSRIGPAKVKWPRRMLGLAVNVGARGDAGERLPPGFHRVFAAHRRAHGAAQVVQPVLADGIRA